MKPAQESQRCPECGARTSEAATICPRCGRSLGIREPECCPVCGARCDQVEARCPICGAERQHSTAPHVSAFVAVALGLLALALVVLLGARLRPWRNADINPDALVAAAMGRLGNTSTQPGAAQPTATAQPTMTPTVEPTRKPTATPSPTLAPTMTVAPTDEPDLPAEGAPTVHVVAQGDTPLGIASQYGITLAALLDANGLDEDAVLAIGQELTVPGGVGGGEGQPAVVRAEPVIHVVISGDTLLAIARDYDVDLDDILKANGLTERSVLSVGQELEIPVAQGTPAPAAAGTATQAPAPGRTPLPSPTPTERPAVIVHTVAKGDTLGQIGVMYGVSSAEIAAVNGIRTTTVLSIGQELIIPGVTPEPTATSTATPTVAASPTPTAGALSMAASAPTTRFKYRTPELLTPRQRDVVPAADGAPLLTWVSVGILEKDEWYRLRVWPTSGKVDPQVYWTTTTCWRPELEPGVEYAWQVQVATRSDEGEIATQLSGVSDRYTFRLE